MSNAAMAIVKPEVSYYILFIDFLSIRVISCYVALFGSGLNELCYFMMKLGKSGNKFLLLIH